MINTYKYAGETWVDIDSGKPEEIRKIMDEYKIHPFVTKELGLATPKPKVQFHDGFIFCILHFPAWKHTHTKETNQEVDFVIGKNILITARYDTIDQLHKFGKALEVKEILEKEADGDDGYSIFIEMLEELYRGLSDELLYIEDLTKDITGKIFKGKERQMVVSISEVIRTLLDFKRTVESHHEVLEILRRQGENLFGKSFALKMEGIIFDYQKINATVRSNLEILRELRDTNNSMLSAKQNEVMKQLTVMGFVVLPLNLIAWIFAMRTAGMPLVDNPNGFWMILVIMSAVALVTLTYTRYKKWL